MELEEIQNLVFEEYKKNGYAERWTKEYFMSHPEEFDLLIDLAEVGLINTEVSELLEDIRDNDKYGMGFEVADIIIRVLNFCKRKDIAIEKYLILKHQRNMGREPLHGRTI